MNEELERGGSEPCYRSFFEAGPEGMLLAADGAILDANPRACELLRRTCEEVIADGYNAVFDPLDPRLEPALAEQGRTGKFGGKLRLLRRDGTPFSAEVSMGAYRDEAGDEKLSIIFRDVTRRERAEDELRRSEAQFRAMVENALDLIAVCNPDNTFRYVSPAFEQILGYRPEELLGTVISDLIHPEDFAEYGQELVREVQSSSVSYGPAETRSPFEARWRCKDGSYRHLESYLNNLIDDPDIRAVVGTARDVTERKRAEEVLKESEQRFRSSFRDASIGMALVATDGHWLQVNRSLCRIVGYSEKELLSRRFQDITHADDLDADLDHVHRLLGGDIPTYQMEKRYLHKKGHIVWVLLAVSLVHDAQGAPLYFISQIQDITERKRAEAKIQNLNETLEWRVAERTEQLAERESLLKVLVGKLVVAQEEERRRVAYEVHDGLAQQAVAAHQHLQAFADGYRSGSATGEELDRALALIRQTVEEARRVIADLRPTTLDDSGLAEAIQQQIASLRAEGWRIDYEESLREDRLPTDVEMSLYRVAQEALTNVRKHARTIRVHVTLARRDHKAYLEVRDWGRGFEQPAVPKAGGPGERVGLSSMRERVALLGGELKITSEPGKGTSVVAEVPLLTPEDGGYPEPETTLARVLIVDDHALVREGMRAALASAPDLMVVGEAANGLEALELCRSSNPDLVIMDVRMPKMDGLKATREIKSEHPTISVLISTTYENPDYMLEAIKAGAAGYVLKGAARQRMLGTIRRVLQGESPLDQELAMRLLKQLADEIRQRTDSLPEPPGKRRNSPPEPLTARELEVARLLPLGKTNQQIARKLGVSRHTVKTHIGHILGKLWVSDRTQAAVRAIELGLLGEQGEER